VQAIGQTKDAWIMYVSRLKRVLCETIDSHSWRKYIVLVVFVQPK